MITAFRFCAVLDLRKWDGADYREVCGVLWWGMRLPHVCAATSITAFVCVQTIIFLTPVRPPWRRR